MKLDKKIPVVKIVMKSAIDNKFTALEKILRAVNFPLNIEKIFWRFIKM